MATNAEEKLISASMDVLLKKIDSTEFLSNFRSTELDFSLIEKLKTTLMRLDMLRDAVYEAHNLFDGINLFQYQTQIATHQVLKNVSSLLKRFNGLILLKLQKLIEKLQVLTSGSFILDDGSTIYGQQPETSTTFILDDESCIYGRDSDIDKLKHLLFSTDDVNSKIKVISIVGMGGIGKTALAKHLYNHPQVKAKFELKRWVDFSNDVDGSSVFKTVCESITSLITRNDTAHINTIYPKFLLVLDGVWNPRSVNWTSLMDIFNPGEIGSKIIITTRDERVAMSMHTFLSVHYLRPLEIEDCWSLLAKHALGEDHYHQRSYLEVIGRKIAKKCDGLPLAAVAHGTLLRISSYPDEWNYVLESNVWDTAYEVQVSLKLSYNFLSDPLKQCFQYCSMFPKKSILEKKMVVQLWIAAGLLESSSTDQEKVGEEYFDELVSRSLILRRSIGDKEGNFEMHDFIHN